MGSIFSFFDSLGGAVPEIGGLEEREKIVQELQERLRFPPIPSPEKRFVWLENLPSWKEVGSELIKLAKEAFRRHTGEVKKIL